jgi:hypothetical protein
MRGPAVLVGAVAVLSIAVVTGGSGPAAADNRLPTLPPLSSISVPPLTIPTPSVSLPVPVPTTTSSQTPGAAGGGGTGGSSTTPERYDGPDRARRDPLQQEPPVARDAPGRRHPATGAPSPDALAVVSRPAQVGCATPVASSTTSSAPSATR